MRAPYQGSSQSRGTSHWDQSRPESVNKTDSLCREDDRGEALSFMGVSGGGFSGEGIALTFAVFPDEPDADKSPVSLAEVQSPPVVVAVGLLDRTVGIIWLGGHL